MNVPFPDEPKKNLRIEPIDGHMDGIDYQIACDMAEQFARERGWSMTRRYPKSTRVVHFSYEFTMSKRGAKDSASPALAIKVGYDGGNKAVSIRRHGKWTAIFCIRNDGSAGAGQYQGESGIDDLLILRELYRDVAKGKVKTA